LGPGLLSKLRNLISRQFRIAFPIEQNPDARNRVTLSDARDALRLQRPKISYDISEYTMQGFAAAYQLKNLMFHKLGATDFTKPSESDPTAFKIAGLPDEREGRFAYGGAGHVMGTYRMGKDPKASVVDEWQCSHDHQNLYLVGSGTLPTVGTANPTLTLCALALRTAEHISKNLPSLKS
jgi:choline dehydrogenase-like flavoprotein